ncbi:AraC family ligand binding domain-containing protein [Paenirhodobacter populi]|nr:AraC family ligand binding domain-containing protein [Sinirhodobacter populi]
MGQQDRASMRHLPELYGIETLSARYLRQTFKPHAHDEYLLGVIDGGVHAVWCRGEASPPLVLKRGAIPMGYCHFVGGLWSRRA